MFPYFTYFTYFEYLTYLLLQDVFDPAGIELNTFPTMAKHIVKAMLPEQNGKVHKLSLHEGKVKCAYITYFAYLSFFLSHGW